MLTTVSRNCMYIEIKIIPVIMYVDHWLIWLIVVNAGINWEAVGISWVLSAVTTCLLIAAAFGIRGCLKRKKDGM